jgi:hypothetical protein
MEIFKHIILEIRLVVTIYTSPSQIFIVAIWDHMQKHHVVGKNWSMNGLPLIVT